MPKQDLKNRSRHLNKHKSTMKNIIYLFSIFTLLFVSCSKDDDGNNNEPPERDHVWVVNQGGTEVSLAGSWILDSVSHPNSTHTVGDTIAFPVDPSGFESFKSDGTYTDPDGIVWTKVNLIFTGGFQIKLLERVVDNETPSKLYVVTKTNEDGSPIAEYSTEHPFDAPGHDINIWFRQ